MKKQFLILPVIVLFLFCHSIPVQAMEWRGIKPLQTTRAEILKMFGNPLSAKESSLGEPFAAGDDKVFIRWARPDCGGENLIIDSGKADVNSLVYQISVELKSPLARAEVEKLIRPAFTEEDKARGFQPMNGQRNCIGNKGGSWACSVTNDDQGFGYSSSTEGKVTTLYYFPTDKENKLWNEKHKPCATQEIKQ